jgi:hypothetical protein
MTPSRDTGSALFSILKDTKRAQEYLRRAFGKSLSPEAYKQNVAEIQKAVFLRASKAIEVVCREINRNHKQ